MAPETNNTNKQNKTQSPNIVRTRYQHLVLHSSQTQKPGPQDKNKINNIQDNISSLLPNNPG